MTHGILIPPECRLNSSEFQPHIERLTSPILPIYERVFEENLRKEPDDTD